ncbi:MAG: hypothetical protein J6V49_07540 [Bacteroidales bacterium]|nr:hypothetical protein [Bacteroidales bacterium]
MAIKALFLSGNHEVLTDSLYQWDYGQELEIEAVDLGSGEVEIHFACQNMTEAIVRPCYLTDGIGVVTIPDDCLEQSSLITAWVYEIAGTQGRTRKVVKIPVIARTRPHIGRDIPTEICDKYTELITEVNTAIGDLKNGNIVVKSATTAERANSATTAGNASTANYAVSAASAEHANGATVVKPQSVDDKVSETTYKITSAGMYVVVFSTLAGNHSAFVAIPDLEQESRGTQGTCAPPTGTIADTDTAMPYYSSGYLRIYHPKASNTTLPILSVYRISDV